MGDVRSMGLLRVVGGAFESGTLRKVTSGASIDLGSVPSRHDLVDPCRTVAELWSTRGQFRTNGVVCAKAKTKSEDLIIVKWVIVKYPNVHLPFLEVVCLDKVDAWWKVLLCFLKFLSQALCGKHLDQVEFLLPSKFVMYRCLFRKSYGGSEQTMVG